MMPRTVDEDGTPCPIRSSNSSSTDLYTLPTTFPGYNDDDDDTADIDFTRALPDPEHLFLKKDMRKKEAKGLKEPPRRMTNYVPPPRAEQHWERHEQLPAKDKKEKRVSAEDAQAVALPAPEPERKPQSRPQGLQQQPRRSLAGLGAMRPSRRRVSAMLRAKQQERVAAQDENNSRGSLPEAHPARRSQGTVKKPILGEKTRNTPIVKLVQKQLHGEKKHLLAPPKRILVQPSIKLQQQPKISAGVVREQNVGKENIQPAQCGIRKRNADGSPPRKSPPRKSVRLSDDPIRIQTKKPSFPVSKPSVPAVVPKHITKSSENVRKRNLDDISFDEDSSFTTQFSDHSDAPGSLRLKKRFKSSIGSLPSPPGLTLQEEAELLPPSDFLARGVMSYNSQLPKRRPLDPVLVDNIERSEMYEESWLSAQESSISQLLDRLLAEYSPAPVGKGRLALRKEFLAMYSTAPFPLIYNRVHASLLYGALSITQHVLDKCSVARISRPGTANDGQYCGWGSDVGAREKFLELLMGSYEQSALITALEVVVGREMFAVPHPGEPEKKVLEAYIERYIIRSEDILSSNPDPVQKSKKALKMGGHSGEDEDRGTPAWLLRRSLLRSFMLIILLDKAKSRGILGRQCLFKKNSLHKSSGSLLKALARLLLPSMGDVLKPLSHLNFTLEATQNLLSEYDYTITNLAVDIRDGVRLTRVVEVLLYSKRRQSLSGTQGEEEDDWPLSLHLQYPAVSRAQKLHNVGLALSALNKANGNPQYVEAKDIVDGYREKTVGLLWGLLSQWGLELLLDVDVVVREIQRLGPEMYNTSSTRDHAELLKNWAGCIAAKHGLIVNNLTTSFSDGKVFTAIVNEYEQYLPSCAGNNRGVSLEDRLKGIGCNSYFAGLFDAQTNNGTVFNKNFVVAGLAYLCSRLVQPSIQERAATSIQRAFRSSVFRSNVHKRIRLLVLAHDCSEVVKKRFAAITIQRVFRKYIHKKIEVLIKCTISLQSLARGALARRNLEDARWAAIAIQQRWRAIREARFQERISVARNAAVGIQALARGILLRRHLENLKRTIGALETHWRAVSIGRQARESYLQQKRAAVVVQKAFRRYNESKKDRQTFVRTFESVKMLQAFARGHLARLDCFNRIANVMVIQYWYRQVAQARKDRAQFTNLRNAILFVQQRRRETVLARSLRRDFLLMRAYASIIKQRYLEKRLRDNAATVIQRLWRARVWIVRMRRSMKDTIVIQSAWRGYLARKGSGPRLRIIRKRLQKIAENGVKEEDTIGARTKQALGLVKTKAGFGRGIAQLENKTKVSRECAQLVVGDEATVAAILTFVDTSIATVQKSATSITARTLTSALNIIANIARIPSCAMVIAGRQVGKGGKDVFNVLLQCVETLKATSTSTHQYELLLVAMKTLVSFTATDAIRRRLCARKKWAEKLLVTLKAVESAGKRRGAAVDQAKAAVLKDLLAIFGDGQRA